MHGLAARSISASVSVATGVMRRAVSTDGIDHPSTGGGDTAAPGVVADHCYMRHVPRLLRGALLAALILCFAAVTATAAVRQTPSRNGHGNGNDKTKDNGPPAASPPATSPGAAKETPDAPATSPGQAKKTVSDAPDTPPGQAKKTTADASASPATSAAPIPVPPPSSPVIGESMGLKPVSGGVHVRLPGSSGYVSLATAGSVPSGAVVDARKGTVVLRSAVDEHGRVQSAAIRGAVFEVRQSADANGMTDLVLRGGRPKSCAAADDRATGRAAVALATPSKKKPRAGALWARDGHGRFRTRGRNSVATVRGTRWSTRETCAGTLTRVMAGAVDVFDLRRQRTVRVRAGHTHLARTSG